jgi:hypothetical protein
MDDLDRLAQASQQAYPPPRARPQGRGILSALRIIFWTLLVVAIVGGVVFVSVITKPGDRQKLYATLLDLAREIGPDVLKWTMGIILTILVISAGVSRGIRLAERRRRNGRY